MDDDMKKALECPVCLGLFQPPVYSCIAGHCFCKACLYGRTLCPLCKGEISGRNSGMEQILNILPRPCKWKTNGCKELLKAAEQESHAHGCEYRSVECLVADCDTKIPYNLVSKHLSIVHKDRVHHITDEFSTELQLPVSGGTEFVTFLFVGDKLYFVLIAVTLREIRFGVFSDKLQDSSCFSVGFTYKNSKRRPAALFRNYVQNLSWEKPHEWKDTSLVFSTAGFGVARERISVDVQFHQQLPLLVASNEEPKLPKKEPKVTPEKKPTTKNQASVDELVKSLFDFPFKDPNATPNIAQSNRAPQVGPKMATNAAPKTASSGTPNVTQCAKKVALDTAPKVTPNITPKGAGCVYLNLGCAKKFSPNEVPAVKSEHERVCSHRLIPCLHPECVSKLHATNYDRHFKKSHPLHHGPELSMNLYHNTESYSFIHVFSSSNILHVEVSESRFQLLLTLFSNEMSKKRLFLKAEGGTSTYWKLFDLDPVQFPLEDMINWKVDWKIQAKQLKVDGSEMHLCESTRLLITLDNILKQ